MNPLHPWANGPFELLLHAEGHLRQGDDFDRRIALISFDNAIEVSITTYLSLHPIQRQGRTYQKVDVERWLTNYHSKLDFFHKELSDRGLTWSVDRAHIIWAHNHRNEQYHGGNKGVPERHVLSIIRNAALWIFSILYDVPDVELVLDQTLLATSPPPSPEPDDTFNRAIDQKYGMRNIATQNYYVSEILFAVDYEAYKEIGTQLANPAIPNGNGESS